MIGRRSHWLPVLVLVEGVAAAQVSPNGAEFQVNTYTTGFQSSPSVAMDDRGEFVVVWDSEGSSGTDTDLWSIQAQRYDARGTPLGDQFQVNTSTTWGQYAPAVAADGRGDFVVAWNDNWDYDIFAQRYDTVGLPLGGEFRVNTVTWWLQVHPAVAAAGPGEFVVVWSTVYSSGEDQDGSIAAQRFDASGTPIGEEFQVNTYATSMQGAPAVAMDDQGGFVAVWESDGSNGTDTSSRSVQAQRYDAAGVPLGGEFQVNTYTTGWQGLPAVAMNGEGNFVVVWESDGSSGTDTSESIQAQRYDSAGVPLGGEFQVNTYTTGLQFGPSAAMDGHGSAVVVWVSEGSSGTDTIWSIQAQRYDAAGTPLGGEFQVNSYTTGGQGGPVVAMDGQGNFVVAWDSSGSNGTDTSGRSVQAQRYDALFRDGFETGDTGRWSSTAH